jgi:hypothetical protein
VAQSALAPVVRDRALDIFDRLARAEARLHGTSVEEVMFHEVGAIDAIVDIVGNAAALTWLAPGSVSAAAVTMGSGSVRCAHGLLPVPSPAALEILREAGGVMVGGTLARELCTPTGAAVLASAVTAWTALPAGVAVAVGHGAGDQELPDRPNVVRVVAVRRPAAPLAGETLHCVETNLDDMNPELCEHVSALLMAAGAVDVWWTPVVMKKSRPAVQLSALVDEGRLEAICAAVLRETTALGVRFAPVSRRVLARRQVAVETAYGPVEVKEGLWAGEVINAAPEYEACRAAALRLGVPLKRIYAAALAAWHARRS